MDNNSDKIYDVIILGALESRLDKGRGPIVSAVLKRGMLEVGDFVLCGSSWGKVRSLRNAKGEELDERFVIVGNIIRTK